MDLTTVLAVTSETQNFKVIIPSYLNRDIATIELTGEMAEFFEYDQVYNQLKVLEIPSKDSPHFGNLTFTYRDSGVSQSINLSVVFEKNSLTDNEIIYENNSINSYINLMLHDTDKDGYPDNHDHYPLDATEMVDSDLDGVGDNEDIDDDNDGFSDLQEMQDGTNPLSAFSCREGCSNLDLDGNREYDALTDGLLLLRGMFGLDGDALIGGTLASNATYTAAVDIESRIATLGDLADIDGNGEIDALTDGLLTLRYLFGLQGDTLINGVVAGDATRTSAEEIEAHLETLMPAL
jgi:hypothetical protein